MSVGSLTVGGGEGGGGGGGGVAPPGRAVAPPGRALLLGLRCVVSKRMSPGNDLTWDHPDIVRLTM